MTFGLVLVFRVGHPIVRSLRHDLRVANVVEEAPGVVSIYVTGRDLERLPVASGQYFLWRFLTRDGWWKAHPFSISAAPNGQYLRTTVKALGDWSAELQRPARRDPRLRRGPLRHPDRRPPEQARRPAYRRWRRHHARSGRSSRTCLPPAGDLTLMYRARSERDVVFRSRARRARAACAAPPSTTGSATVRSPDSPTRWGPPPSSPSPPTWPQRDVYLCGPDLDDGGGPARPPTPLRPRCPDPLGTVRLLSLES